MVIFLADQWRWMVIDWLFRCQTPLPRRVGHSQLADGILTLSFSVGCPILAVLVLQGWVFRFLISWEARKLGTRKLGTDGTFSATLSNLGRRAAAPQIPTQFLGGPSLRLLQGWGRLSLASSSPPAFCFRASDFDNQPLKTTVQPRNSTIPCKTLYLPVLGCYHFPCLARRLLPLHPPPALFIPIPHP